MTRPRSYSHHDRSTHLSYAEIFAQRGRSYDIAMTRYPNARRQEFEAIASRLDCKSGQLILDVPAGGGYLAQYLPSDITLINLDTCQSFFNKANLDNSSNLDSDNLNQNQALGLSQSQIKNHSQHKIVAAPKCLPFADNTVDTIVSLAGLHHEIDKAALFTEFYRVLKPCGTFCIADVYHGSDVAIFLDTIIDKYNSQGHQGIYLNSDTNSEINASGLYIQQSELVDFHWQFESEAAMVDFTRHLFGLDQIVPKLYLEETRKTLGVEQLSDSNNNVTVGLNWQLNYITGKKS